MATAEKCQAEYEAQTPPEPILAAQHEQMDYWLDGIEHAIHMMRVGRATYERHVPREDRIDVGLRLRQLREMLDADIEE